MTPSVDELNERIHKLTEAQMLDFRRRLDSCQAVMTLGETLVLELQQKRNEDLETTTLAGSRWFLVWPVVAVALMWLGHIIEVRGVETVGYLVLAGWFFAVIKLLLRELNLRRTKRELEARLEHMYLHWLSAGGSVGLFHEWRKGVEALSGARDDDLVNRLHTNLLNRVLPYYFY